MLHWHGHKSAGRLHQVADAAGLYSYREEVQIQKQGALSFAEANGGRGQRRGDDCRLLAGPQQAAHREDQIKEREGGGGKEEAVGGARGLGVPRWRLRWINKSRRLRASITRYQAEERSDVESGHQAPDEYQQSRQKAEQQ